MIPDGFLRRMERLLGAEAASLFAALDAPRSAGLHLNTLKTDKLPDLSRFSAAPVPWAEHCFFYDTATRPGLSPYHDAGLYYLQEPSAMAPAGLLDVRPGMRVLDLCAAPGGKTMQLACALRGEGLLVANEIHPGRAKILSRNLERCAVQNALVLNEHPAVLAERFAGYFDRVLVDAPCSGEGMFRKEDAAAENWSEENVLACARRQSEILRSAAKMLAPGGRLVYSTCTFSPAENEGVISEFLHSHPGFSTVRIDSEFFSPARPDWIDDPAPGIENAFRLWPHKLRGEGHFAAVLQKAEGGESASLPTEPTETTPAELRDFAKELALTIPFDRAIRFGQTVFSVPGSLPALRGLKVLRAGLALAQNRGNRFEPEHAWALASKSAAQTADFREDDPMLLRFLQGQAIPGTNRGWTLITADGYSLGWAKGSDGQLKNHIPKGLRRMG
ncbi:MAG: RsmB/NOP family class I SAM-dependent RNA methyltransferase [Oscillospiraceae bacterium]|nr:RsmB/NOP family class I SAM-dependent RNA methyltransferase [Oscillospiraceae bacterium]